MALAAALAELHAQARCPLCQGPLCAPLTLDCGHNCCSSCLRGRWQHLREPLPCPVCQQPCSREPRGTNTQLAQLADLVSRLPGPRPERHAPEAQDHCAAHQQPLNLFCEDHLELLCDQCGASAAHRGHRLTPIGPAAAHHRTKLKGYLEPLRKQLQEAQRAWELQDAERQEWREKVANQRTELLWESEHLKHFLRIEHNVLDMRVLRQVSSHSKKILQGKKQLSEYGASLQRTLWDVIQLCLQPDLGLLAGLGHRQLQCREFEDMELPAAPRSEPTEAPTFSLHLFCSQNVISKFRMELTLDPESAHQTLVVTRDRGTVIYFHQNMHPTSCSHPQAFTSHPAVLGAQGFEGGRHFWQVEIRGSGAWSVGVCKESFPRNAPVTPSPDHGCWRLQPLTSSSLDLCPSHVYIGVFLDYELGKISFYNMLNRSLLCTLTERFTGRLRPYFAFESSSLLCSMNVSGNMG
ncbi:tripartite motif-containing protein 75-like [Sorex araneus]|uniref:tripartite motif-containing protein 75-like n=1 Tax=Sorex araneus TaxID=42254 RepID=UPI002433DB66|nr:tripartite motif-containing protein 75-like [Sorex araneus]